MSTETPHNMVELTDCPALVSPATGERCSWWARVEDHFFLYKEGDDSLTESKKVVCMGDRSHRFVLDAADVKVVVTIDRARPDVDLSPAQ